MSSDISPRKHDRLQAPLEDRAALVEPPFDQVADLVSENRHVQNQLPYDLNGRSLTKISQLARAELLDSARRWTGAYRNLSSEPPDSGGFIYLAGHQPQMFHPGVWFKNFALGELARRNGATAVNLIVDSDALTNVSLRVPGGSVSQPDAVPIPFDRPNPKIPFEERRIEDLAVFEGFGQRVVDQIASLVADPLIRQYWPLVLARAEETDNLGACLAQARHQLEGTWGLETLEIPQSYVCSGEAFQWFAAHLLVRLPEFHKVYNKAVREYRQAHRVRSFSHPVPELAQEEEWLEAPLWVWTADNPHRRRLFARSRGGATILSDRQSWEARLPLRPEGNASSAVERLLELQREGVRIRSRALVTTLWARLALSDLFIHGIGGAKYDRVTDRLIERFFGLRPPGFMVVSATLHLPIERDRATANDAQTIQRELRSLMYHPEQYLDGSEGAPTALAAAKRQWIETFQTKENARERCRAIRDANTALQPWLEGQRRQILDRQATILHRLRAESVLASREYAFCLYPEPTLKKFLSGLLHKTV